MIETIISTVVSWIDSVTGPLLAIVIIAGVLYCAARVVKFITAEDEQERGSALRAMISSIVGFVIIFAIALTLNLLMPSVVEWANESIAATSVPE